MKLRDRLKHLAHSTRGVGGDQAIEWIMVLFLAGLMGGALFYTLTEFKNAINDNNTTIFVNAILDVFQIIPTWLKILVIIGFASAIALVGLGIYKVFMSKTTGM